MNWVGKQAFYVISNNNCTQSDSFAKNVLIVVADQYSVWIQTIASFFFLMALGAFLICDLNGLSGVYALSLPQSTTLF